MIFDVQHVVKFVLGVELTRGRVVWELWGENTTLRSVLVVLRLNSTIYQEIDAVLVQSQSCHVTACMSQYKLQTLS